MYVFILMFPSYMKRNEYMDIGKKTENMKVARIQSAVPLHMPLVAGMLHPEEEHKVLLQQVLQRALGLVRVALRMAQEQLYQQGARRSGLRQVEVSWVQVDLQDHVPSCYNGHFSQSMRWREV